MKMNVKTLININKFVNDNISQLENICSEIKITSDKEKATFGNACVALRGFRMVADATEAMLINENVLQDNNGNFYQKIEENTSEPSSTIESEEK